MLELGDCFRGKISSASMTLGSSSLAANNTVPAVLFSGGFISNIARCLFRLHRNRSFTLCKILKRAKYFFFATCAFYDSSAAYLKEYRTVVGWPTLMAAITITSSAWDIALAEWSKWSLRVMGLRLLLLTTSVVVVSVGMFRLQHP